MKIQLVVLCSVFLEGVAGCGAEADKTRQDLWRPGDMGVAAASAAGSCSTSNCVGCCDGERCVPGNVRQRCGVAGVACRTCLFNQVCQMGFCTEPLCSAGSCAEGCCDVSGKCRAGTSDDACGAGGAACASCGGDQVCQAGVCTARGGSRYRVTLVSAIITGGRIDTCGTMELWGACDAYVILKVGGAQATSSVKANNNTPTWNEFMLEASETELTRGFDVEIRDDDPFGSVELGQCQQELTSNDLNSGTYVHACGGTVKELTWNIDPV